MNLFKNIAVVILVSTTGAVANAGTPKCAAQTSCVETRSFVATVTSFRTSKQGAKRVLTVTVHFDNKTNKPLTIGYVTESGMALDELGNRYEVPAANAVRAIGEISGTNFDPKFTLPVGEGSDARFELAWEPGKAKAGAAFELDLAIREITPANGDQFKLGQEHALHFADLGQSSAGAVATAPPPKSAKPSAPIDPCGGSTRCVNAGAFIAEIMQVTPTAMTKGVRHHSVSLNIRFRNISDKPIILGYQASSSTAVDNFGNGFTWGRPGTYDTSVKGIGIVSGRSADTQFALSPGQSRNATFNLVRFNAVPPIGESWTYDVVIAEVEVLPGQVVKTARENSLNFTNVSPGTFAAVASSGGTSAATGAAALAESAIGEPIPTDANSVANKMIDLIANKAKKKK